MRALSQQHHQKPARIVFFCLLSGLFVLLFFPVVAESSQLLMDDCVKCHLVQPKIMAEDNNLHAVVLGCLDCHPNHPPAQTTTLACTDCHSGKPHYEISDCLHCHTDPHRPISLLQDPLKPARAECISCHPAVGEQLQQSLSRHAKLFCNRCHTSHKQLPACLDCHSPHLAGQPEADCGKCHPAHQPLRIVPTGYLPATACRACHKEAANDLATTTTLHGGINCIYCHKGQHPFVPECQDCHGLPHSQAIHSKHRDCLACHGDAHKLISGGR